MVGSNLAFKLISLKARGIRSIEKQKGGIRKVVETKSLFMLSAGDL